MLDAPFTSLEADYLALLARRDRARPGPATPPRRRRSPPSSCFAGISCCFRRSSPAPAASSRRAPTTWPSRFALHGLAVWRLARRRSVCRAAARSAATASIRFPARSGPQWNAGSFSPSACRSGPVRLPGVLRAAAADHRRPSRPASAPGRVRRRASATHRRPHRAAAGAAAPAPPARRLRAQPNARSSFDTARLEVVLTNRGGRVLHWRLKDYLDDERHAGRPGAVGPAARASRSRSRCRWTIDASHAAAERRALSRDRRQRRPRGRDDARRRTLVFEYEDASGLTRQQGVPVRAGLATSSTFTAQRHAGRADAEPAGACGARASATSAPRRPAAASSPATTFSRRRRSTTATARSSALTTATR